MIGGGITGTGVARDAARRGFRTALVEARDFAEGTSGRSSRLVHGGLRYLEQGELSLVLEGSRERRTLLRIAPHLVRPLEFVFPVYRDGRVGPLRLRLGMWLYDALALFRNIERHRALSAQQVLAREPGLRAEGLRGGARYYDAQVDDARLVLTTARAAAEAGAAVVNRTELVRAGPAAEGASGRAGGAEWRAAFLRDVETGEEWKVAARAIVNATGPWTDVTLARAGRPGADVVRPTRGSHVHVSRERLGHERALIFESPVDGRIVFILPWGDLTLIGTTDTPDGRPPVEVRPSAADVRYLLATANGLFPRARLSARDVVSAWAGLRPLAAGSGAEEAEAPDAISRDFVVREEPPGIFTVAGGKLTSHRAMAEEAVNRVARRLKEVGVRADRGCDTARVALPGGDFSSLEELRERVRARAGALGVESRGADRLTGAYGTTALEALEVVAERPALGRPLAGGRPEIAAEVVWAVRREMAVHAEDVLYRRTHVGWETRSDAFGPVCRRVATLMGEELGWDEVRVEKEAERARAVRARDEACLEELEAGAA